MCQALGSTEIEKFQGFVANFVGHFRVTYTCLIEHATIFIVRLHTVYMAGTVNILYSREHIYFDYAGWSVVLNIGVRGEYKGKDGSGAWPDGL